MLRYNRNKDNTFDGGAPYYKKDAVTNSKVFKFFDILNLSIGKSRTIKRDTMLKLTCATKCLNLHMHPQIHSQDSQHFTLTLDVLPGAALPHLSRDAAVT